MHLVSLFVSYVWHPHFLFNGLKKCLTWLHILLEAGRWSGDWPMTWLYILLEAGRWSGDWPRTSRLIKVFVREWPRTSHLIEAFTTWTALLWGSRQVWERCASPPSPPPPHHCCNEMRKLFCCVQRSSIPPMSDALAEARNQCVTTTALVLRGAFSQDRSVMIGALVRTVQL